MSERREFKIGDRVRIRDWDDMVREFGEPDSDGDIKIVTSCKDGNTIRSYNTWFLGRCEDIAGGSRRSMKHTWWGRALRSMGCS